MHDILAPAAGEQAHSATAPNDTFLRRHAGPNGQEVRQMLETLELPNLDALIDRASSFLEHLVSSR